MKSIGKLTSVSLFRYLHLQQQLRKKRRELLLFLDHLPVITAGINYNIDNLLVPEEFLQKAGIEMIRLKRGGDLTAHEPGQLVIYPHIDLKKRNLKIAEYSDMLQDSILESVKEVWDLDLIKDKKRPGLYLRERPEKKLVSVGLDCKSFFTSFGAALNTGNDLTVFKMIRPCGEDAGNMVSLKLLGLDTSLENEFIDVFDAGFRRKLGNGHIN